MGPDSPAPPGIFRFEIRAADELWFINLKPIHPMMKLNILHNRGQCLYFKRPLNQHGTKANFTNHNTG